MPGYRHECEVRPLTLPFDCVDEDDGDGIEGETCIKENLSDTWTLEVDKVFRTLVRESPSGPGRKTPSRGRMYVRNALSLPNRKLRPCNAGRTMYVSASAIALPDRSRMAGAIDR